MRLIKKKRSLALVVAIIVLLVWISSIVLAIRERTINRYINVSVTGAQNIGRNFEVLHFFMDGHELGNAGRNGGGGVTCCVTLPTVWKQSLSVELRWEVADWTDVSVEKEGIDNYNKIRRKIYIAHVPIEEYRDPNQLRVEFFAGGYVRISSDDAPINGAMIDYKKGAALEGHATKGQEIVELFTKSEMQQIIHKIDVIKRKNGSDWQ